MAGISSARLSEERKNWRRDHPYGFFARPSTNTDGSLNLYVWNCGIPGKIKTNWEGGVYPLIMEFTEDYPSKPPKCRFPKDFFHPNVYPSGTVCLSILNEEADWKPSVTIKTVLLGIQDLLDNPNPKSPAQQLPIHLFLTNKEEYDKKIKAQSKVYPPPQ
ncbi:hypothetical protein ACTFIY_002425 [Dictyostelium cf. discoideum]